MRIMKVILTVRDKSDQTELDSNPHAVSIEDGVCRVVVPMFDHWTNTKNYSFGGIDMSSEIKGEHLVIEFPDERTRVQFQDWLTAAFAEAAQGYRTMWP